ncbi:MAG: hypothetical protein QM662_17005 [Gordonia sp. (in: high G+C Gram-positive bacteria)]
MTTRSGRDSALDRLPLPYGMALRLRDAGVGDDVIATSLGVEPDELPMLMHIARAKLASLGYAD